MSKVVGPLLSLGASGSIAGALTYSNWKGIATVRLKSNPTNPKTVTQMHARALFAGGGKISKSSDPTQSLAVFARLYTPSGQSWISYFVREMLGAGNVNIEASITAYNLAGNAAKKAFFDNAAGDAGVEGVNLDGTNNTIIPAGALLWAAYTAGYRIGFAGASAVVTAVTENQVFLFTEDLTGVLPT